MTLGDARSAGSVDVVVRNAAAADLDGIMAVEEDWPAEQRAPRSKFESRLERFPEGVFVAEVDGRVVGVTTSCLIRYDAEHAGRFTSWDAVTNDGWLRPREEVEDANALYVVSTGIMKAYRGLRIFPKLFGAQVELTEELGLDYCVTGAILEGYAAWCREHGDVDARTYALTTRDGVYVDPLLRKLQRLGLAVPDERHVVPEYFASEDAHDWSAIMVAEVG
jgi:hypothetical protein